MKRYNNIHRIPGAGALLIIFAAMPLAAQMGPGMMMGGMNSEYEFLAEMIPHHQEAVDTAREVAGRTDRRELREFTEEIARVQSNEIEMMQEWLEEWYPQRSGRADYQPMMRPTRGLSSDRADRAFLEDMIMHHRMAIMMAYRLLRGNYSDRPEVQRFAEGIIETQNREIEQMETWLEEWYGVSLGGHMMGPGMGRRSR
jgi:uncharacterized protein (DUF305 family)